MATSLSMDLECPVCHEAMKEPKILPCCHMACKGCLLTWLTKVGTQGGCPLCRAPIITSTDYSQARHRIPNNTWQPVGDPRSVVNNISMRLNTEAQQRVLNSELDALPTNLVVVSLVEGQQILQSPHICGLCGGDSASTFCMECNIKLCSPCLKCHQWLPSAKYHTTEELSKLTTQRLLKRNRATCDRHPDKTVEFFCSSHQHLICMLCGTTIHGDCKGKIMVDVVVPAKKQELTLRVSRLKEDEKRLQKQIQESKDEFKAIRQTTKVTFDTLQKLVDQRRLQVEQDIARHEESVMTSVKKLEQSRIAISSNVAVIESLKEMASSAALLGMMASLTARLDALDKQTASTPTFKANVAMVNTTSSLQRLQDELATMGQVILKPQKKPNYTNGNQQETVSQPLQTEAHPIKCFLCVCFLVLAVAIILKYIPIVKFLH